MRRVIMLRILTLGAALGAAKALRLGALSALICSSVLACKGSPSSDKSPGSTTAANQDPEKVIKIGVLSDMSGLYADLSGKGSVIAAQMAVEDAGKVGD